MWIFIMEIMDMSNWTRMEKQKTYTVIHCKKDKYLI